MKRMHAKLAQQGLSYTRIEGVPGELVRNHPLVSGFCQQACTDGMIGCAMSHIHAWKHVVAKGLSSALILEDDAVFVPNFKAKLAVCMEELPGDWDVLLGGCVLCNKENEYKGIYNLTVPFIRAVAQNQATASSGTLYPPEFFLGTHCYVVSQRGARNLLSMITRIRFHIDFQMNTVPLHIYASSTQLAYQHVEGSTIATSKTPMVLDYLLSFGKTDTRIPFSYLLSVPIARGVNIWSFAFLVAGMLMRLSRGFRWVLLPLLLDTVSSFQGHRDAGLLVLFFMLGEFATRWM